MSSSEHPDRDSLSAYLEESLSIDATQWIKHHLGTCASCRDKLEQERAFLAELDSLRSVRAPSDFTQGVMARVAQYPTYQPRQEVPWRRYTTRGFVAAGVLLVVAIFVGWVVAVSGSGQGVQVGAGAGAFTGAVDWTVWLWENTKGTFGLAMPVLQIGLGLLLAAVEWIRNAPFAVHLAILLITVGLNYGLTRMVLNYQRRQ